jgi:hypothetical protein
MAERLSRRLSDGTTTRLPAEAIMVDTRRTVYLWGR